MSAAASPATRCSAAVRASGPARALRRGRAPAACSSSRARRASRRIAPRSAWSSARRSGARASARRLARRRAAPRSTSARVCSSRAGEPASTSVALLDRLIALARRPSVPARAAPHRALRERRGARRAGLAHGPAHARPRGRRGGRGRRRRRCASSRGWDGARPGGASGPRPRADRRARGPGAAREPEARAALQDERSGKRNPPVGVPTPAASSAASAAASSSSSTSASTRQCNDQSIAGSGVTGSLYSKVRRASASASAISPARTRAMARSMLPCVRAISQPRGRAVSTMASQRARAVSRSRRWRSG